jgi:hypothetical protein
MRHVHSCEEEGRRKEFRFRVEGKRMIGDLSIENRLGKTSQHAVEMGKRMRIGASDTF